MSDLVLFDGFASVLGEVSLAFAPLMISFLILQVFFLRMPREFVLAVLKGSGLALVGLALFLHGVHIGFLPAGMEMGLSLGRLARPWLIVLSGAGLGFLSVIAEPAVRVLAGEVERASSGSIRESLIVLTIAAGVGVFVALGMVRILLGLPVLLILIPGYTTALLLTLLSRRDPGFVSIAFDSGGVATGPMTVTFTLALAVGVATAIEGRSAIVDGFGLVALVALAPILSVLILGLVFRRGG